jgi:nucleoside-diphosphate-sugar epimerase
VVTEADWNDAATLEDNAFAVSKVKAERAAWEMVDAHNLHSPEQSVTLISILPSYVIGPPISALTESASIKTVQSWFDGSALDAGTDEVQVNCVDVRDVAKAHLAAIERPMIHGRYIVSLPDVHSPLDIIAVLRKLYPNRKLPDKYSVRRHCIRQY